MNDIDFNNNDQLSDALAEIDAINREYRRLNPPKKVLPAVASKKQYGVRASNRERSGSRDMTVSANARAIGTGPDSPTDNIRHVDTDLYQVCSKCARSYVYLEDSTDTSKASRFVRAMAEDSQHLAWAALLIHSKNDVEGKSLIKSFKVWENGRKLICDAKDVTWDQWRATMEKLHVMHVRSGCRPRKAFD